MNLEQLPGNNNCLWHKHHNETGYIYGSVYQECPILWHTLYPYFLGFVFGAKYGLNEKGDCQVGCPAEKGVDLIVRVRPWDKKMPSWVPSNWRDVIHAEVVDVHGKCPYQYLEGERIVFPTCAKTEFPCPAGVFNIFPVTFRFNRKDFPCINSKKLRCPDWKDVVFFAEVK